MPIVSHHGPTSTPAPLDGQAARRASTLEEHARDGGFLAGLKKWGVGGAVVAGLVMPALVAVQLVSAPRSPVELDVPPPAPPAVTRPAPPQPAPVDVFVPGNGGGGVVGAPQPARPVEPPASEEAPPAPAAPPVVSQPPQGPPPVDVAPQPTAPAPGDVAGVVQRAFVDGSFTAVEAKDVVNAILQKGPNATVVDWQLLTTVYVDARTSADARRVFDSAFVRAGVPVGKGAAHIEQLVMRAVAGDALGPPLRGRLPTQNMMRLDLTPTQVLPQGAAVWTSPGARPQAFVDIPGQGVFGPLALTARGDS